jgi:hypothetical protein
MGEMADEIIDQMIFGNRRKGKAMAFDKTKSKTKYIKVRGKVSYAKLYEPDDFRGEKKWKINLYPDAASYDLIKKVGMQNKFKDDDGSKSTVTGRFCTLSRPCEKQFGSELTKFTPPEVLDKGGKKLVYYEKDNDGDVDMFGEKVIIGNGSECEIELAVYQTARFGAGSRFNSVRIIDLIEYVPPEDLEENEVDGDDDAPFEVDVKTADEIVKEEKKPAKKSSKVTW